MMISMWFVLFSTWQSSLVACLTIWVISVITNRRYFHPLSSVPGPFLWAVSGLPILYQQHFKEGNLIHTLTKLHAQYGAPGLQPLKRRHRL